MLEGDHFLSHWLKVGRTLTQTNLPSIFRTTAAKLSQWERRVTGTCRHVMEKHCRTDYHCENSCTDRRTCLRACSKEDFKIKAVNISIANIFCESIRYYYYEVEIKSYLNSLKSMFENLIAILTTYMETRLNTIRFFPANLSIIMKKKSSNCSKWQFETADPGQGPLSKFFLKRFNGFGAHSSSSSCKRLLYEY